jgi:AraC family transcriptional regulator
MPHESPLLGFGTAFDTIVARKDHEKIVSLTSNRCANANPPHRHVNDYVCMVLTGSFAETRNNTLRERRAGSFFAYEAGDTHHDCFGPTGATCLNLHFASHEWPLSRHEGFCSTAARLAGDRLALELTAHAPEDLTIQSLTAELMAEIHDESLDHRHHGKWVERLIEAISDEPRRRWSLVELAAVADRHPVHVAQTFRAKFGMSLGEFQRRQRLICLSLALRRGKDPLAMLANEFGYCDQSHMTSEFRTAFGVSPGRYRRDLH